MKKKPARILKTFIIILTLFVSLSSCDRQTVPELEPARLFLDLEAALAQDYYYAEGEGWNLSSLYARAQNAIGNNNSGNNRTSLVAFLEALPTEADRRARSYVALRAFLDGLPIGYNTFTRAESLVWSRDPRRSAGVGLVLRMDAPGRFLTVDTLEGSASYRENMQPGNYLAAIDGKAVGDMDLEEVVGRIRGPAETRVELGYENGQTFRLLRGEVSFRNILNAEWKLPRGARAEYIMLRSTLADTVGQLRGLLARLGDRQALILDLRRLHHGDYENCFGVANLFVSKGQLGGVHFRNREPVEFVADAERVFEGPIYVVLGENASPFAETLASALSVAPNVRLVGAPGKGRIFVSTVTPVNGGVELTLTGGLVLGPGGAPLYESGIAVDDIVPAPLPRNPPLNTPDSDDPVQVFLANRLGL